MKQAPVAVHAAYHASSMQELGGLMTVLDQACRSAGADADALFSVRLAVEEVFTNILQYGYAGGTGPVTVDVDARPERLRITLTDAAPLFDPGTVAAPDPEAPLEQRAEGGWGWHLVRESMDQVEWAPNGEGGNLFTLVKWLTRKHLSTTRDTPQ